jgi:alkyl sulfatase BDS1-like metallo-beta-lactamase superfamily hydrolase
VRPTRASDAEAPLLYDVQAETVAPGIHTIGGAGRSLVVETPDGVLLVDTGAFPAMTDRMQRVLRDITDAPVRWIVYSHGHLGYNYRTRSWIEDAQRRGHPRPTVIAHQNVVRRYRRYEETAGLQNHINTLQFRGSVTAPPGRLPLTYPDVCYSGMLTLRAGQGRTIQLIEAPSETDDATAIWLPEHRVLYGGAAVIEAIPNIGTPMRTMRDTIRWADTLDRLAALDARAMVPEFGPVVRDPATIAAWLGETASFLRWLRRQTVERMNRGMTVAEILHDIEYPPGLFDKPWLRETYGHRDYIVRDIYRSENGWWEDRNPTSLHPAPPAAVAEAIASAITDKRSVLDRAAALRDSGQLPEAMHVVDLLALALGDAPEFVAARQLKRELSALLADRHPSFISQSEYAAAAKSA